MCSVYVGDWIYCYLPFGYLLESACSVQRVLGTRGRPLRSSARGRRCCDLRRIERSRWTNGAVRHDVVVVTTTDARRLCVVGKDERGDSRAHVAVGDAPPENNARLVVAPARQVLRHRGVVDADAYLLPERPRGGGGSGGIGAVEVEADLAVGTEFDGTDPRPGRRVALVTPNVQAAPGGKGTRCRKEERGTLGTCDRAFDGDAERRGAVRLLAQRDNHLAANVLRRSAQLG
jgi:hypothetical protein